MILIIYFHGCGVDNPTLTPAAKIIFNPVATIILTPATELEIVSVTKNNF